MRISKGHVAHELEILLEECTRIAAHGFDPLHEIAFTLNTDYRKDGTVFTVVIDRNSGGSPESDYAIQDEVRVFLSLDGDAKVTFSEEMMQGETLGVKQLNEKSWEELLAKIEAFCRKHIPDSSPFA